MRLRVILLGPQAPAPHAEGRDDNEPNAHQDVEERHHKNEDMHLQHWHEPVTTTPLAVNIEESRQVDAKANNNHAQALQRPVTQDTLKDLGADLQTVNMQARRAL